MTQETSTTETAKAIVGGTGTVRGTRHLPLALGLLLVIVLLVVGALQGGETSSRPSGLPAGSNAPDFTLMAFDGRTVRLSELRGRPVVINFWASWCPPCREEAPALRKVAELEARADGAAFVGINVRDREEDAKRFVSEFGIPYPNGPDPGDVEARYAGIGIPYTVFIASDGTIARTWVGPLDEQRLIAFIEELS